MLHIYADDIYKMKEKKLKCLISNYKGLAKL